MIAEDRPDLDTDLLGHILLSPLHSGVIQSVLADDGSGRLATSMRTVARTLLQADSH